MSHPHDRLVTNILNQIQMVGMESSEASEKMPLSSYQQCSMIRQGVIPFRKNGAIYGISILLRVYHRNLRRCAGFPSPRQVRRANREEEDLHPNRATQGSQQVTYVI